ncbi:MAG: hypothetical protein JO260_03215 [Acidobacteria bacterium]|nr:hypothetical protein [Acidobacteriota bacterium]
MNPKNQNRTNGKDAPDHELDELSQLKHVLQQAMSPVPSSHLEPGTDSWPQLRARIESQQQADRAATTKRVSPPIGIRVHWFDWALAAVATAALVFFPGIIPALLYHF